MEKESSTKDSVLEAIRDGMRDIASSERKEHRASLLNKNRVALGDIVEDASYTTEFVTKKAKALKRKALPVQEYRHLQNALIQNEENVNSFLKVDHVLSALVRDISGKDPTSQLCAVSCCCNLALGNAKACISLAKSISPYLIMELESLNRPLLEVCAWTIGNLVAGSAKAFEILHAQDCLKYIISLIKDCDAEILPSVIYMTLYYVYSGCNHISENEMIEVARVCADKSLSFDDPYFVWLLALLSSNPACNTYLYNRVSQLVDYLYERAVNDFASVTEVTASIRILANTTCESSGEVALHFLENSKYERANLQMLLNKLLSHQHIHIRKETLWLIGNLCNHDSLKIQQIMRDILPHLSYLNQAIMSLT